MRSNPLSAIQSIRLAKLVVTAIILLFFGLLINQVIKLTDEIDTDYRSKLQQINAEITALNESKEDLEASYSDALEEVQTNQIQQESLEQAKQQIENEYTRLVEESSDELNATIHRIYGTYGELNTKIERNQSYNLDVSSANNQIPQLGVSFLNKEYSSLEEQLSSLHQTLDEQYTEYLASLPTPTPIPTANTTPISGYSYQNVTISSGTFGVYLIKLPRDQYSVKTVAANESDCYNKCPAKPLATYIAENNAYAGIHGTYFCPPDYASCKNKTYSYDFALYDSNQKKWLNERSINWDNLGLVIFNGSTPTFFTYSNTFDNRSLTAGIVNFPTLLFNGKEVVIENTLSSYLTDVRATRGAIAANNQYIFLAVVSSATVTEAANVLKSLGAQNALNLDGGGSAALYIGGSYKVGPGRLLPNAIVLTKK